MATSTSRKHRALPVPEFASLARRALGLGLIVAFGSCRRGAEPSPSASASGAARPVVLDAGPERLPEDPVKGAKSTAQWTEHLREEERERKRMFDRNHAVEHRAIIAALDRARASFDAARSEPELAAARARFQASLPALEKRVGAIDPDRQSSRLLPTYERLLEILSGPYPSARRGAFGGDDAALRAHAEEFARDLESARNWLEGHDAEEKERERE